jgi:signal transduction histidine kinase
MAERIRAFDWSRTELGNFDTWPRSLSSSMQLMLASPLPMVMLWGRPGYMIYNDAYSEFAGGRHPYLLGSPVELGWPEVAEFNRHVVDTCLAGGTLSFRNKELVLLRSGIPEDVWMDLYYSPIADDDGKPGGVMAMVVETSERVMSERRRQAVEESLLRFTRDLEQRVAEEVEARLVAEEQLRQSQKLEAIGGLTGGVAHDFNNLLQVIAGNLHLLARHEPQNANVQRRVAASIAAVERGAKLSSQLLAFARRQPLSPAICTPRQIFDGLGELLQRALGETLQVHMRAPANLWRVFVDRNQLENAILNLAINARDAMKGEGTIDLGAENIRLDRAFCTGKGIVAGDYVRVSVADTGAGMPPQVLAQAFEPFFTTKPDGQGTGLGLSMVFGFVKQSGGHIEMSSVVGQGTRVQLYFPRSLRTAGNETTTAEVQQRGGHERILVVEDNEAVRNSTVELLREEGYQVLTAANADVAMQMLLEGGAVDLIFTDVVMPGLIKSSDLAAWAKVQNPPVTVLFTSGHTRDIISRNHQLSPDTHLLGKPYGPDALTRMIRTVLNG